MPFKYFTFCKQNYIVVRRSVFSLQPCPEITTALSGEVKSAFSPQMCSWSTVPLSCRFMFSRDSLPLIKKALIPFGAIILSQLLNGRDSIIPLIAHNPIGSQTWVSLLLGCSSLPARLEKSVTVWWVCVCGLECLSGSSPCAGILHTKGGLSNKYCWGQEQTVVKISASFRCLVLSYPLLSWPFFIVNQYPSQPT